MSPRICITGASGCLGRALCHAATFARGDTVVHLIGTPHPNPRKAAEFQPYLLLPVYGLATLLPATRATARRLGLMTLSQMTRALVRAIADPPPPGTTRVVAVPEMRAA